MLSRKKQRAADDIRDQEERNRVYWTVRLKDHADDEDYPYLEWLISQQPAHLAEKSEARLELERELFLALSCIYLHHHVCEHDAASMLLLNNVAFSLGRCDADLGPYELYGRPVDREGHRRVFRLGFGLPYPFLSDDHVRALREEEHMPPYTLARQVHDNELQGALVHSTWIQACFGLAPTVNMPFMGSEGEEDRALAACMLLVHRTAMTLTKVAFRVRAAALALAQDMGNVDAVLAADAEAVAALRAEHPWQVSLPRFPSSSVVASSYDALERQKRDARIGFEAEVLRVLDWCVTPAIATRDGGIGGVVVCLSGLRKPWHAADAEEQRRGGMVPVADVMTALSRHGQTCDAVIRALMVARGFEHAAHALVRATHVASMRH